MKIGRYQTALTATLILVVALLIARPAVADFVSLRLVDSRVSEKPASGFLTSSERINIKETWTLTPQLRWGNDDMHARYYSAWQSRFLSVDPAPGDPQQPQSWNRYNYVLGNPLKYTDPFGLIEWDPKRGAWTTSDEISVIAEDPIPQWERDLMMQQDIARDYRETAAYLERTRHSYGNAIAGSVLSAIAKNLQTPVDMPDANFTISLTGDAAFVWLGVCGDIGAYVNPWRKELGFYLSGGGGGGFGLSAGVDLGVVPGPPSQMDGETVEYEGTIAAGGVGISTDDRIQITRGEVGLPGRGIGLFIMGTRTKHFPVWRW